MSSYHKFLIENLSRDTLLFEYARRRLQDLGDGTCIDPETGLLFKTVVSEDTGLTCIMFHHPRRHKIGEFRFV
jgi:hypothetical protein